jgi:hypothetical protein
MDRRWERLLEYLDAMDGSFGCGERYAKKYAGHDRAWMSGHYHGMLDDLIDAIGKDRLDSLIRARVDIEAAILLKGGKK